MSFLKYCKIWIQALRLPFLTATIIPVVLGTAIAWHATGACNWIFFLYTVLGIAFLNLGTNLTNDYFDNSTKNDELNHSPTRFSGGSRVIQDGLLSPRAILIAAIVTFCSGSAVGIYLSFKLHSYIILVLGIIGVFCGYFYTARPIMLGYKSYGELIVGLCLGPLVVFGSYYVQTKSFSLMPIWASIPIGLLVTLILYINEFPDYEADTLAHKKTLIVLLGKEKAVVVYHMLLGGVYFCVLTCVLIRLLPFYTLIVFLTFPLAVKAYQISKVHFNTIKTLLPANALTITLHLTVGLLLSAGFIIDKIFKIM